MKFQKTLLAVSLATIAVAANAQDANPVSVTEGLQNPLAIYPNGWVSAPVNGRSATSSTNTTDVSWLNRVKFDGVTQSFKQIDLGTGGASVAVPTGDVTWDAFSYTSTDGTKQIFQFEDQKTGDKTALYEYDSVTQALTRYTGGIKEDTRQAGGQIVTSGGQITSGFENRRINSEHVIYGYQGGISSSTRDVESGTVIDTQGNTQAVTSGLLDLNASNGKQEIRYVQQGIIANTGALRLDGSIDPAKNIYGVSARDNDNVTVLTGNGIALANIKDGKLQTDGSVLNSVYVENSGTPVKPKTYKYEVGGKHVLEIADLESPNDYTKSEFYEISATGKILGTYAGNTANLRGTQTETGVVTRTTGTYNNGVVHNTVTNQNVTYSEKVETVDQTRLEGATINADRSKKTEIDEIQGKVVKSKTEQSVSTGIIGVNNNANVYGVEVKKTVIKDGATTSNFTTITTDGVKTTGVIDAKDFTIGGVSIIGGIKNEADKAVGQIQEAVKGIDTKLGDSEAKSLAAAKAEDVKVLEAAKAEDVKVLEAAKAEDVKVLEAAKADARAEDKKTLDAANAYTNNAVSGFGSRIDQLNRRVDDVERTANRGVAIALVAQQAVPNIAPGQVAVFGGVGHYEGETAGSIGVVTSFTDRISASGALGFAGGNEFGGRVGVAYVFGGK